MKSINESYQQLYGLLERVGARPKPFEFYTAADLWTDEHTSAQMLQYHLNPDIDLSSRNHEFIEKSVEWIVEHFDIGAGSRVADFGCGPGLYANRLAQRGASVTGIDFSPRSIAYAREIAESQGLDVTYLTKNYLNFQAKERFDLIIMIFCDFCALSPDQRRTLLGAFRDHLKPDGKILLDVHSLAAFADFEENSSFEKNLLNGFWSADDYYGFQVGFKYEDECVRLDKYTIVDSSRIRTVYNWLQYFDLESLTAEFAAVRLSVQESFADVAGSPYTLNAPEIAIVAGRQ